MNKLRLLNVGCGNKYHSDWVNIDMVPTSPQVIRVNLLKGIPFADNSFDVVYHSQVLEHFPKNKAQAFIKECYRVLKPGGIIRIVVPDLEEIVDEYKKYLAENLENPTKLSEANYDWILLEMYDQTVRSYSGGEMAEFTKNPKLINKEYIENRGTTLECGHFNVALRQRIRRMLNKSFKLLFWELIGKMKLQSEASRVGHFRLSGEVHQWMYDRYSLSRLLKSCGFTDIEKKNPFESGIPEWGRYELDVRNGVTLGSASLFIEAKKI